MTIGTSLLIGIVDELERGELNCVELSEWMSERIWNDMKWKGLEHSSGHKCGDIMIYLYIHIMIIYIYIHIYLSIYWPTKTMVPVDSAKSGSVATTKWFRNPLWNPLEWGEFYVGRIRWDPPTTRFPQFLDNVENIQVDANYMVVVCRFLCDLRVARHLQTCYARHSGTPVGHVNLFRIESG